MSDAQLWYDTLKKIARAYMTPAQCHRSAGSHGLEPTEMIAMTFENIQIDAERAIKGKRRPKE